MEASDGVGFALGPDWVIGRGARQSAIEERMTKAANVNHQSMLSADGHLAKARAQLPGGFFVEARKLQCGFLAGDDSEIVGKGHGSGYFVTLIL